MIETGIIRRVDDLGQIVLPKEIRRKVGISEGTPMEIFMSTEGILLKKYYPEHGISEILKTLAEAVEDMCNDLEPEKARVIQRHVKEMQDLINTCEG